MGLESVDGSFCCVAAMHIWGYDLIACFPVVNDVLPVGSTAFVIQNLEIDFVPSCTQSFHDGIIGSYPMLVTTCFERGM